MKTENAEMLSLCLSQLGLEGRKDAESRLLGYADLVLEYNKKVNLVGTQDEDEFVVKHLADSLSAWTHFQPGKRIADIGTGAGLPGIPLAIVLGNPVTLVESKAKKAEFLSMAVKTLGLTEVRVLCANANEVKGHFDCIVSRAFSEISHTLKLTSRMAQAGTEWLFYKGRKETALQEVSALSLWKCEIIPLVVPLLEGERHLVRVTAAA